MKRASKHRESNTAIKYCFRFRKTRLALDILSSAFEDFKHSRSFNFANLQESVAQLDCNYLKCYKRTHTRAPGFGSPGYELFQLPSIYSCKHAEIFISIFLVSICCMKLFIYDSAHTYQFQFIRAHFVALYTCTCTHCIIYTNLDTHGYFTIAQQYK